MDDSPTRILLIGDFSGSGDSGKLIRVDNGDWEDQMPRFDVLVRLANGSEIKVTGLEDFHPDRIYAHWTKAVEAPMSAGVLDRMVEAAEPAPIRLQLDDEASWNAALRQIVKPHLEAAPDSATVQAEVLASTQRMRETLQDESFRRLEANWRGAFFLLQRIEAVHLSLLDSSKESVRHSFSMAGDPRDSGIWKQAAGDWDIICGLFSFKPTGKDCALAERLGALAAHCGGLFMGAASENFSAYIEDDDLAIWQRLRASDSAASITLLWPDILMRPPYGKTGLDVEAFPFEEFDAAPRMGDLLWGSASLAGACAAANGERTIAGLPAGAQPATRESMSDRDAERLVALGISPVIAQRGSDAVFLPVLQTIRPVR